MHHTLFSLGVATGLATGLATSLALPLAAQDMALSQILVEDARWELVVEGYEFTDGLTTDAEGNLYFSDVKGGKAVFKVDLEGKVSEFIPDAPGISGLKWGADGRLFACVSKEQKVVVFSKEGARTELAAEVRPNDLVVTHDGNLYFTMTPTSEIRRIDPAGKMTIVSAGVVTKPNGIALSRDQGTLAVSDHGGKFVWTFRIEADGTLAHPGNYMTLVTPDETPEVGKGDGMTTDVHGRYYVTSAEGLQIYDPTGRLCGVLPAPDPKLPVVSTCFAGPGHAWLYVGNGGKIWRRKTQTSGALAFAGPQANEVAK
jgi:enterochelin esterase family protein